MNRASRRDLLDAQAFFLDFLIKNPKVDLETRQKAIANYTKEYGRVHEDRLQALRPALSNPPLGGGSIPMTNHICEALNQERLPGRYSGGDV
jgi:hypothetical protein